MTYTGQVTPGGPTDVRRLDRATGALSTSLLAAGMSGVDFGSCEVPR